MSTPVLVTGDDISLSVTLKKNGVPFTINPSATVTGMLVSQSRVEALTEAIAQSDTTTGADWANSLVVVKFASADTAAITTQGAAILEIQVDDGGKRTWFVLVTIARGNID